MKNFGSKVFMLTTICFTMFMFMLFTGQSVSAASLTLGSSGTYYSGAGGNGTVSIQTSTRWCAYVEGYTWIYLEQNSGSGNSSLKYKVSENPSTVSSRTGYITVRTLEANAVVRKFAITQYPSTEKMTLDIKSLDFGYKGGSQSLTLSTNCAWKATTDRSSFISISSMSGARAVNGTTITITCAKNTGRGSRSGIVRFTGESGAYVECKITQNAAEFPVPPIKIGNPKGMRLYDNLVTDTDGYVVIDYDVLNYYDEKHTIDVSALPECEFFEHKYVDQTREYVTFDKPYVFGTFNGENYYYQTRGNGLLYFAFSSGIGEINKKCMWAPMIGIRFQSPSYNEGRPVTYVIRYTNILIQRAPGDIAFFKDNSQKPLGIQYEERKCYICGIEFPSHDAYLAHMKSNHKSEDEDNSWATEDKLSDIPWGGYTDSPSITDKLNLVGVKLGIGGVNLWH